MEESEKRKERLKAMRSEAVQANVSSNLEAPGMPGHLSNPFNETPTLAHEESCAAPRFDFYTDPMSAFSANKKRNTNDNQIRQNHFSSPHNNNIGSPMGQFSTPIQGVRSVEMNSSHALQMHSNQRMNQARGPYDGSTMYMSPRGMSSPSPLYRGHSPDLSNRYSGRAGFHSAVPFGSPRGIPSPFPMHQGNPEPWNSSGGRGSYGFPSNPSYAPEGGPSFNHGQGRPHWRGNSPSPGPGHRGSPGHGTGRGSGRWHGGNANPRFAHGGGRGQHSHSPGAECFYHVSMEEDPWKDLKPVLLKTLETPGRSLTTPSSSSSWLPKSISMKKQRVEEASDKSNPQQSLAEYLAASFNEAMEDPPKE